MSARWPEEEVRLMARAEATATSAGILFMNQFLQEKFPNRTLDAIKGKRRQEAYREMVQGFLRQEVTSNDDVDDAGDTGDAAMIGAARPHFHKILAKRLAALDIFDKRQRGFRPVDGVCENITVLSAVLDDARRRCRTVHMACVDLSKAFDTVSHTAIHKTLEEVSLTQLGRGVRQGDPLSPLLFNLVVDRALGVLSEDVGYRFGGRVVGALGYADDIVLLSSTKVGLQENLTRLNAAFELEVWTYLGSTYQGAREYASVPPLARSIELLTRAPLKPQQRLRLLRDCLLPRFYHQWAVGSVTSKTLRGADVLVRTAVRRWLRLPHDVPAGYFHAPIQSGGLGMPLLRTLIPILKYNRLRKLCVSSMPAASAAAESTYVERQLAWCENQMRLRAERVTTTTELRRQCAAWLHESCDGKGLREVGSSKLMRCRAGCPDTETPAHCVQRCFRTHGGRILRHDDLCRQVGNFLRTRGWHVDAEHAYSTSVGRRRPDLTIVKNGEAVVVDAQVVSSETALNVAHDRKVEKYRSIQDLRDRVAEHTGVHRDNVRYAAITISWRGVWSPDSERELKRLGLTTGQLRTLTTRVGAKFEDLIRSFGMNVVNDAGQGPTFWTARGSSFIDVTLTSPSMNQFIGDWKVRPDWTTSDHNAVDIRLRVPKGSGRDRGAANMRFDIRRADWERFAESLTDLSRSKLEVLDLCSAIRVEEMAETMAAVLTEACAASMPRKRRFRKSNPWWTMELTILKKRLKYRFSLREYSREVRKAKLASWRKFVTSHGNSEPWGFVYKHQAEKLRVEGVLSTLRCGEYSTKTLEETAGYLLDAHTPDDRENEDTLEQREIRLSSRISPDTADALFFTATEIAVAVKTFKSNKAPGLDLVEVSVLKTAALSTIYRGVFAPTVAYAAAGWADLCTESDVRILKALQRQVLISTTGAYRTASWESLCVVAGVMPVDLLLREYTARYQVRIGNNARIGNVEIPAEIGKKVAFEEIREEAINMDVRRRLAAPSLESEYWSTQALTGHGDFRARLESLGLVDSDVCVCESGIDTVQHFLLDCPLFEAQREALRDFVPQSEWKWPEAAHFFGQSVYPGRDTMDRPSRGPRWWAYWCDRTVHPAHKIPQALLDFSIARLGATSLYSGTHVTLRVDVSTADKMALTWQNRHTLSLFLSPPLIILNLCFVSGCSLRAVFVKLERCDKIKTAKKSLPDVFTQEGQNANISDRSANRKKCSLAINNTDRSATNKSTTNACVSSLPKSDSTSCYCRKFASRSKARATPSRWRRFLPKLVPRQCQGRGVLGSPTRGGRWNSQYSRKEYIGKGVRFRRSGTSPLALL
ncbi:hypothetical protein ACFW04_013282 [Cataglyphis niger]